MMWLGSNLRQSAGLMCFFVVAYPGRSTLMLVALTAAALAEGIGIAALLPLIGLVIESENAGGAVAVQVERFFALLGLELSLGALLALIVAAMTLKSLLTLLAMTQVAYSAAHAAMDLRLALVRALLLARWTHIVDRRAGELASAANAEPARAANAYVASCRVLSVGIQLLIYLALAVAISFKMVIAALFVGVLGVVAFSRLVDVSRRAGQNETKFRKSFTVRLLQALDGMKPLKAMALEERVRPLIEGDIRSLNETLRVVVVSRELLTESHEILRVFAVTVGLYAFVAVWGQPVEGLLVLALLFVRALQKAGHLQSYYQTAVVDQPAFAFVRSTIAAIEGARELNQGAKMPRLASAISLRDVSFSYDRSNVLDDVSMTMPAGSFTAVVGSSGAGKTTVADLIIGLLRPNRGEVWIDDLPLRDIDVKAWRGMIGYVPQDTFLFHDTVMANVTLGEPNMSRAEVEAALRRAEAWEFVTALLDGMDTVVGERGARLSGGQRQRIAIARALVRKPALLILDEATTALDPETEAGIVATVRRLAGKVTVLSISHQPAIRDAADIVYRLDKGRVTLDGTGGPITFPRIAGGLP